MSNESFTIDREPLLECFGQWHDENDSLANQINESVAALTEYQQQLETWQLELEQQQSQQPPSDQSPRDTDDSGLQQRINELNTELNDARKQIGTMSADLLAKTEELRQLDKTKVELTAEVEKLRAISQQPEPAVPTATPGSDPTANEAEVAIELQQMRALLEQYAAVQTEPPAQQAAPANTPAGSVAAQFNRLRQQQAADRTSKKPRN